VRGVTRLTCLGAIDEKEQVAGPEAGRGGGIADAAHAKAIRLGRDQHVCPAERRDLACEAEHGRHERRREGAEQKHPRHCAHSWRNTLHFSIRSKEDASYPVAWILLTH
jgi:hypothetical protein